MKPSCLQSNEDLLVRLGLNRGEVFTHVLSSSSLYKHVKWSALGVPARLWLMCTHCTGLALMLSQEHHNLCWPWTLFHMPFTGLGAHSDQPGSSLKVCHLHLTIQSAAMIQEHVSYRAHISEGKHEKLQMPLTSLSWSNEILCLIEH